MLALVLAASLAAGAGRPAAAAPAEANGTNVLVIHATGGPDGDGDGTPDGRQAAEYYARRRGVPNENILALKLPEGPGGRQRWTYRQFFESILKPVCRKLDATAADGTPFAQRIDYLLLCPDVPVTMATHPQPAETDRSWFRKTRHRSVDGYLISPAANLKAGFDRQTGMAGPGRSGAIGSVGQEVTLPLHGAFRPGPKGRSFHKLRGQEPSLADTCLVSRLGLDLDSARNMIDGALYAERHLRLPKEGEDAPLRPAIWLDMKYQFAADHVAAMTRAVAMVQGVAGSPFSGGKGLLSVWPLVIDIQPSQIGAGRSAAHKPTVTAPIASNGVDERGVTLWPPGRAGRAKDVSRVLYFPPGCTVACVRADPKQPSKPATAPAATGPASPPTPPTAKVIGADPASHRLLLDSTEGFKEGHIVKYVWPGEFPADDCFIFYGFYGLGAFEDVRRFPPGAIGVHVDSSCMNWARGAIGRGIAATFGVTGEPLSAGVPYGDRMLLALAGGYNWAEAAYGSLRLAQRWTGVVFGDPLYAPFRSRQVADTTPPVIGPVTAGRDARGTVTVAAALAGRTDDELADVALFRLDYGPTKQYGQVVDFFDWPEPQKGGRVKGRRFGYSRHFRWVLKGLQTGKPCHYRLTARDPAGNETRTPDAVFTP